MPNTFISKVSKVLISGASIAGPTLAYWLSRYGFDVTIVELSRTVRSGGYPIDVRGTAVDVAEQMGIYDRLQQKNIHSEKITFLHPDGSTAGMMKPILLTGGSATRDIDLPRGDLTAELYQATLEQSVRCRFDDSIAALHEDEQGIHVDFKSGEKETFDIVIGADGMHSNTRRFIFGDEAPFTRYLGYCFAGFSVPNTLGLAYENMVYALPGRYAILAVVKDSDRMHAFLNFATDELPNLDYRDTEQQRQRTAEYFKGNTNWIIPELVGHMLHADDFYFDTVSQIRMPSWHKGRVALVGDSAYAPSFLTGQGSSLAMVGAYVLAGELAGHENYRDAFAAYERIMRPFAEANQSLANNASFMMPRTADDLAARNELLDAMNTSTSPAMPGNESGAIHSSLQLPDYSRFLQNNK